MTRKTHPSYREHRNDIRVYLVTMVVTGGIAGILATTSWHWKAPVALVLGAISFGMLASAISQLRKGPKAYEPEAKLKRIVSPALKWESSIDHMLLGFWSGTVGDLPPERGGFVDVNQLKATSTRAHYEAAVDPDTVLSSAPSSQVTAFVYRRFRARRYTLVVIIFGNKSAAPTPTTVPSADQLERMELGDLWRRDMLPKDVVV
jgi:hypothetical protein